MPPTVFRKFERLLLEVEVSPDSKDAFFSQYSAATGLSALQNEHCQIQTNKWGLECRMYFDAPDWVCEGLRKLGYSIEPREGAGYRSDYPYRINSQELFWQLVDYGYRLGCNDPVKRDNS